METTGQLEVVRFEGFVLDLRAYELSRHGVPCHIEPQAFDTLAYLVRNRHRVVTRSELLETIWAGTVVTSGAIAQCVSTLRRALRDTGREQRFIRTYPRVGYRFVSALEPGFHAGSGRPAQAVMAVA